MNNADRQSAYRKRRTEKQFRMENALREIAEKASTRTGPLAQEIRKIAEEALGQ